MVIDRFISYNLSVGLLTVGLEKVTVPWVEDHVSQNTRGVLKRNRRQEDGKEDTWRNRN
jgi:hypothetical protein